jgi:hypothetical protein
MLSSGLPTGEIWVSIIPDIPAFGSDDRGESPCQNAMSSVTKEDFVRMDVDPFGTQPPRDVASNGPSLPVSAKGHHTAREKKVLPTFNAYFSLSASLTVSLMPPMAF